jgi:hypothetical protein
VAEATAHAEGEAASVAGTVAAAPNVTVAAQQQLEPPAQLQAAQTIAARQPYVAAPNVGKKKEKNVEKVKCFRCKNLGHYSVDCTAVLFDFCEESDHANADCPLHSAPKPSLSIYGYGHEELMFIEVPHSKDFRPSSDGSRMGMITVTGGEMILNQLVDVLRWVVIDDDFQWDVQPQGKKVYKTLFPNKMELIRATRVGKFEVKDSCCFVEITDWKSEIKPSFVLRRCGC